MDRETYEEFLHGNMTKTYKKIVKKQARTINVDAEKIAKDLELEVRIERQESKCYTTVKSEKEDLKNITLTDESI